jgi:hypothetical protein
MRIAAGQLVMEASIRREYVALNGFLQICKALHGCKISVHPEALTLSLIGGDCTATGTQPLQTIRDILVKIKTLFF